MFVDRSVRYLSSLGGISTSRVLNLAACSQADPGNGGQKPNRLIESPVISRAILVKHRVRPHEEFLFGYRLDMATKIIVPADPADLSRGGESFFVDQRGFKGKLREIGQYPNGGLDSDSEILQRIAELPSLDRFLVRGHLRMCGIEVSGCLELTPEERGELDEFAATELAGFVRVVSGEEAGGTATATSRLVRALFVDDIGAELEPFRAVLGLERNAFAHAIFAWRGFLYCKWQMRNARGRIPEMLAGLQQMRAPAADSNPLGNIGHAKAAVAERVFMALKGIRQLLQRYQAAYTDLVHYGRPANFRAFLVEAPRLFPELAEKTGAISHMLAFWRCRFPSGVTSPVDTEEIQAILQDFESGFAMPSQQVLAAVS